MYRIILSKFEINNKREIILNETFWKWSFVDFFLNFNLFITNLYRFILCIFYLVFFNSNYQLILTFHKLSFILFRSYTYDLQYTYIHTKEIDIHFLFLFSFEFWENNDKQSISTLFLYLKTWTFVSNHKEIYLGKLKEQ